MIKTAKYLAETSFWIFFGAFFRDHFAHDKDHAGGMAIAAAASYALLVILRVWSPARARS